MGQLPAREIGCRLQNASIQRLRQHNSLRLCRAGALDAVHEHARREELLACRWAQVLSYTVAVNVPVIRNP